MELRTLLFLLCWSTFVTGTLSKQLKHGFKNTLHDNMKEYFRNYMVGNWKGVNEKQFDTLKLHKWIGEDISKRAEMMTGLRDRSVGVLMGIPAKDDREFKVMVGLYVGLRVVIQDELSNQKIEDQFLESSVGKRESSNEESPDTLAWFHKASDLRQKISNDIDPYFKSWSDVLNILPGSCDESDKVPMSTPDADLSLLGLTPVFMNLFWPFRFDMNIMNQRMAAYDLTNNIITENNETLKVQFFEELQNLQGIRLPVKGNQIMLSFADEAVAEGLNRSSLVPQSESYVKAGKHLFTEDEKEKILLIANKALDLINKTHTELYSAMVQMISCIAFFKDEASMHMSGSVQSAVGLIWLDPRQGWTVPLMAEQIVHEFIHTSLFYAELVHGGYKDVSRLAKAKAMSSIRHEPRDYDKSLHAAYVSAGLITFHTRAGFLDRAANLAETLPEAVQELNRVNAETDVLDEAGRAMLDFLTDYVCLTRM